jgi:phosphoglycolate phosphatase-like HAD superfamily hydrolase
MEDCLSDDRKYPGRGAVERQETEGVRNIIFDPDGVILDLAPAETVFVDDHQPNIEAAQAIGLHTILFRDARKCEVELEPMLAAV